MKRVFIIYSHPVLAQGVQELLSHNTRLNVVGCESDIDRAIEQIKALAPDSVIVDAGDLIGDITPVVTRILAARPESQVVQVSLDSNTLNIFRRQQKAAQGVDDLMQVIEQEGGESPGS